MKKGNSLLYVILLIVVIAGIAGGTYYLGQKSSPSTLSTTPSTTQQTNNPLQPTLSQTQDPLFSGKVQKINKDLGLFKVLENDTANDVQKYITYFEAGIFTQGEYKDYTRILAVRPAEGPGPSLQYLLATKDFKTYLLHDPENKTTKYPEKDWDNPFMYLDKNKIAKTVTLDSEHPLTIGLEKPFALIKKDEVLIENKKNNQKDTLGNDVYLETPITQFSSSPLSISSQKQLTFYPGETAWGNGEGASDKEKKMLVIRKKYLNSTTYLQASDSTGLTYSYLFTLQKDIDEYLSKLPAQEEKMITYKKQVLLYDEKKLKEYPPYPESISFPGMRLTKQSAQLPNDYYNTYDMAFPGACGGSQSTFLVSQLKDSDLSPLSSTSPYSLYVLKDNKHPLYELAYDTKSGYDEESFKSANDGKSRPSFNDYIAKHPLLFFKDAWGRWGVMGEFDIKLMGGCGKPVVYLYPEISTVVHLDFATPVTLDTQIPVYNHGWLVKAEPNGTLTDLQPQYTDCAKIDSSKSGSEYASGACKNNAYPYLYWSGKSVQNPYPKMNQGWIVEKENLQTFMNEKLKEIGLTEKETNDMISYWVPQMSAKNTPYYRISFSQTKEMNEFIPMTVSPQPDSILRVFLDYQALTTKPEKEIAPQSLEKFVRKGFTLVEWGGLK